MVKSVLEKKPRIRRAKKLFLATGYVTMRPLDGRPLEQQTQTRLVWAWTSAEAIQKYGRYFASIATRTESYTVDGVMITEAIDALPI